MSRIFELLECELGLEYKSFLRLLGLTDEYLQRLGEEHRKIAEVIHQALNTWLKNNKDASREKIIDVLRSKAIARNDLANQIEKTEKMDM